MRARGPAHGFLALMALVACDNLAPIPDGVCGNQVVDHNEDCDTFAGPGTVCLPPGSVGQCRYSCAPLPNKATPVCPSAMGCGNDGICRAPTGTFLAATQPIAGTFVDLLTGDVDGQKRDDVVGVEPGDVVVSYFDATMTNTATIRAQRGGVSDVYPLLRDINGDGLADLLEGVGGGTLVELGSPSGTFVPTACPASSFAAGSNLSDIVLKALPATPGDQVLVMGTIAGYSAIVLLEQTTGVAGALAFLPRPPDELAGPVVVGNLDENPLLSPCDEVALAFMAEPWPGTNSNPAYPAGNEVDVYTSCAPDGMGGFGYHPTYFPTGAITPTAVLLSNGATVVRGPLLLDVNDDGHLDFLVGTSSTCSSCYEVQVAYGVGDGTFHSNPNTIPPSMGDNTFSTYTLVAAGSPLPLAMGDLNGDGVPDQVTPTEVLVSHVGAGDVVTFAAKALNAAAPWTEAVIADLNHDGVPDVAAGSASAPNIEFYAGVGDGMGTLNPFEIQTAPVRHLTVGDFDGDLVNDLAVSEIAANNPLGDSVSVLWGNSVGAPSPPVSMGRFVAIKQMTTGRFTDPFGVVSGVNTLLTVSTPNATATEFGSFAGSGDRVLRSPYQMSVGAAVTQGTNTTIAVTTDYPQRFAFGQFTSADGPVEVAAIDQQYAPPPVCSPFGCSVRHVWLLPTDGTGEFATLSVGMGEPVPPALDWSQAAIAAIDLDGSGLDQLVALGPSLIHPESGALAIARVVTSSTMLPVLAFGPPSDIAAIVARTETSTAGAQSGRLRVADIDGDGNPNLVAVATIAETSGATPVPHVVVFWNDLQGQLGAMAIVPNPIGQTTVDFALVNAGGPAPDVAVLTNEGVSLASFAGRAPNAPTPVVSAAGGVLIAAGDFDGDGVADLVVADAASFVVYRGQPVHP